MKAFKIVLELIRTQGEQCKVTGVVKQSYALEGSFKIKWSELRHSFFHTIPYTILSVQKAKRRVLPTFTIYNCRAVTITPHKQVIKYPFLILNPWLQRPLYIINIPRENPHISSGESLWHYVSIKPPKYCWRGFILKATVKAFSQRLRTKMSTVSRLTIL